MVMFNEDYEDRHQVVIVSCWYSGVDRDVECSSSTYLFFEV